MLMEKFKDYLSFPFHFKWIKQKFISNPPNILSIQFVQQKEMAYMMNRKIFFLMLTVTLVKGGYHHKFPLLTALSLLTHKFDK